MPGIPLGPPNPLPLGFTAVPLLPLCFLSSLSRLLRDRIRAIQSSLNQTGISGKTSGHEFLMDLPKEAPIAAKTTTPSMASNVSRGASTFSSAAFTNGMSLPSPADGSTEQSSRWSQALQKASGIGFGGLQVPFSGSKALDIALSASSDLLLLSTIVAGVISVY